MKSLRKISHFTQRELAALAGISQSSITHSEKGRRNLPANATIKIIEIQALQEQMSLRKIITVIPNFSFQHQQKQKLEKMLKRQLNKALLDAVRLSQTLAKMQERFQQQTEKLALIQILKEQAMPATREMSLLELMEIKTHDKIKGCSVVRQTEIRYQLLLADAKKQVIEEIQSALQKIN